MEKNRIYRYDNRNLGAFAFISLPQFATIRFGLYIAAFCFQFPRVIWRPDLSHNQSKKLKVYVYVFHTIPPKEQYSTTQSVQRKIRDGNYSYYKGLKEAERFALGRSTHTQRPSAVLGISLFHC